jgi:hypothetical protein
MSYYILPKSNNNIFINPKTTSYELNPYISHSLLNYYNECKTIVTSLCGDIHTFSDIIKVTNPHEYVFSKVPGSKFSVSKLKTKTNMFYDLLEIHTTLDVFSNLTNTKIQLLHIGVNCEDSVRCCSREECDSDIHLSFPEINNELYKNICDTRFDFLFYEIDQSVFSNSNLYTIQFIKFIMIILKNQSSNGNCIIKIHSNFYKPITDGLYILSSLFEKVYIIKPNTSNIMTFDKYIVCKNFILDDTKMNFNKTNYLNMYSFLRNFNSKQQHISSLIDVDIPSYFINKIDDANIIIGQQQLETFDQLINILNNKNKHDKIDLIKKSNIQKSVAWCEKYKIPCNKFSEKTNIFLPLDEERLGGDV